ncbi:MULTISPECIES: hypothetical protein [Pyrobaculum]|nr:hypothetical protein [Pyrobaculum arsenaticum]AFA39729.1 hypothetical protein Pogu_1702 [Pyrobaculum oguniense TE7]MCY0889859.1 hypothetical protein [Pyrobaculum arsenaticum]NYR14818.1 hypothetical protein [Pyrobaculum arsenaticum]
MEIIAVARGPWRGSYYIAVGPPRCGVLPIRLEELPTNADPPFKATYIKTKEGAALFNIVKVDIEEYLITYMDHLIEGEINNGVLEGVVCNKKVKIRILDRSFNGPVLAVVPVVGTRKKVPKTAILLLAYKIQLV